MATPRLKRAFGPSVPFETDPVTLIVPSYLRKTTQSNGDASAVAPLAMIATGAGAIAGGPATEASGEGAAAFGSSTKAIGRGAAAFGYNTNATGKGTAVFGENTVGYGDGTFASGFNSTAYAQFATAHGVGARAYGTGAHDVGMPSGHHTTLGALAVTGPRIRFNGGSVGPNSGTYAMANGTWSQSLQQTELGINTIVDFTGTYYPAVPGYHAYVDALMVSRNIADASDYQMRRVRFVLTQPNPSDPTLNTQSTLTVLDNTILAQGGALTNAVTFTVAQSGTYLKGSFSFYFGTGGSGQYVHQVVCDVRSF